jgi:hypothetical protein
MRFDGFLDKIHRLGEEISNHFLGADPSLSGPSHCRLSALYGLHDSSMLVTEAKQGR